ncbi:MAG: hypothetical protein JWL76_1710 [Thermoleophilia bacterium]|nr:hypothetical protein [Thermoleophilia bacterium]
MLVLLPPSETKAVGGDGAPLALDELSFAELTRTRERLGSTLVRLGANPARAAKVLGLGRTQAGELRHNQQLLASPTMPAIRRYTGVLYDSLDYASLRPAERARADERLAIGSALFGVVRASDPIPAYRLSGGTKLPRLGTLGAVWKPTLGPVLADIASRELVVDLRSGAYRTLAPIDDAVTVRVMSERPDGSRGVVSHFNKATKGLLARLLVRTSGECGSVGDVMRVARRGGLHVEQVGDLAIDVVTSA